jgi:hypothetical protein
VAGTTLPLPTWNVTDVLGALALKVTVAERVVEAVPYTVVAG